MAWSISDLFPPWGDAGSRPSDNFQYDGGDQVNEKHFDYLWHQVGELEKETRSALTDIDSDSDGIVDAANEGAAPFTVRGDVQDSQATPVTIWDDVNKHIPTGRLQADTDGDGLIEDYDEALIKDGGLREIDASEFAGSNGTSGQVLTTDGAAASWGEPAKEWTELARKTPSGASSVSFSGIGTWDMIRVRLILGVSGDDSVGMTVNGITTSNYNNHYVDNPDNVDRLAEDSFRIRNQNFDINRSVVGRGILTIVPANDELMYIPKFAGVDHKALNGSQNSRTWTSIDSLTISNESSGTMTGTIVVEGANL